MSFAKVARFVAVAILIACVPKNEHEVLQAESSGKGRELARLVGECVEVEAERNGLLAELDIANRILERRRRELAEAVDANTEMEANIEEMTLALKELDERRARAEQALDAYRDLLARFQSMIDAGTLSVTVIDGRMIVKLKTDILFDQGSAALSSEGAQAIANVAGVLADLEDRRFQIAGHTDNEPIATAQFPSNWHLGSARAIAVTKVLVDNGLPSDRVSAASYGDTRPADTNRTDSGRANNRRIEIVLLPNLEAMPGFEELKAFAAQN
jgi:chemotaxis protein MotB